jgi:serine-type D-Ala-D-Ala carboxypeptidase (penicillin-binding protein 5/6)
VIRRLVPRSLVAICLWLALAAPGTSAAGATPPVLSAPESIAIDGWNGTVLYARDPDVPRYPASTVKIMTALVVLSHHVPLHRMFQVSYFAATYGGSTAGLYSGERMTVKNLLFAMLLPSGNDAALTLAEGTAGSDSAFVVLMNQEASRLGLWHTHYLSPTGLDFWGQVSTARDLAVLARAAMSFRMFARVVRTRHWSAWSADHRIFHRWTSLNQLLGTFPAVNGVKTGTTPLAGACLVSSAREQGKWVIAVNLGSTTGARFSDGAGLLSYGLAIDRDVR